MHPLLKWAASKGIQHINDVAVLLLLAQHGPQKLTTLAGMINTSAATLTCIADRMEKRGLAIRRPLPTDRRAYHLTLTPEATAGLEHLSALAT